MNAEAAAIVRQLGLRPHPEGGHFRETWRAREKQGERSTGSAIYYLLAGDEASHWHRVDADEIWHWYAGSPLALLMSEDGKAVNERHLGPDLSLGQRPQAVVASGWWQAARCLGGWALMGCTVSPGFEYSGFEMAPPGWSPGQPMGSG